jgi:hypothetical protein
MSFRDKLAISAVDPPQAAINGRLFGLGSSDVFHSGPQSVAGHLPSWTAAPSEHIY